MYSYKKNNFFLKKVEGKECFAVKSILVDMIQRTRGNEDELKNAIEYAIRNRAFQWEVDDNDDASMSFNDSLEKYNFFKEKLVQNFSKERYSKVIKLCKEVYPEQKKREVKIEETIKAQPKATYKKEFKEKSKIGNINKKSTPNNGIFNTDDPQGLMNARIALVVGVLIIIVVLAKIF